jgi:hypothetical protein
MNKDLQNEIDALVKLGQTGVHTVTRSQAFKDTGWEPTEAYSAAGGVVAGVGYLLEEQLTHGIDGEDVLPKSPEKELELLKQHLKSVLESEEPLPYLIESLRSSEGQECGLFTEFYMAVWNTSGTVDDCRWVVFPSLEELDLFLLKEGQFRLPSTDSLLRKWNRENREFWEKIYEFHEK